VRKSAEREQAKLEGRLTYFTGKPCPSGHIAPRYTSVFSCTACHAVREEEKKQRNAIRLADKPLSPRKQAQKDGATTYNTGKPCPRGHFANRHTSSAACSECARDDRLRYEQENPTYKSRRKSYATENAEAYRNHARNRRAKRNLSEGQHTKEDILDILRMQMGKCAYCRVELAKWHVDHIMPISLGGHNGRRNLQLTCKPCNLRKSSKDPLVFARELGLLL